jgi:hypothetical protein
LPKRNGREARPPDYERREMGNQYVNNTESG